MTATELIAIVVAAIGAISTGVVSIINGIRRADDAETLQRRVQILEDRDKEQDLQIAGQDRQIAALDRWKLAARRYIAQLRGTLADRGIASPEPPPELELNRED